MIQACYIKFAAEIAESHNKTHKNPVRILLVAEYQRDRKASTSPQVHNESMLFDIFTSGQTFGPPNHKTRSWPHEHPGVASDPH
jgi:hypothetical protein